LRERVSELVGRFTLDSARGALSDVEGQGRRFVALRLRAHEHRHEGDRRDADEHSGPAHDPLHYNAASVVSRSALLVALCVLGGCVVAAAFSSQQTGASRIALATVIDPREHPIVDVEADDFVVHEGRDEREILRSTSATTRSS
jgi:hypothetical protein